MRAVVFLFTADSGSVTIDNFDTTLLPAPLTGGRKRGGNRQIMLYELRHELYKYRNVLGARVSLAIEPPLKKAELREVQKNILPSGKIRNMPAAFSRRVYLIGSDKTYGTLSATIIAVIRQETADDIYIAAPVSRIFYEPDIRAALTFDPRLTQAELLCLYEKSCGAVTYTIKNGRILYLLIKNQSGHVGFPKGHVEYGESEWDTIRREVFEETGLHIKPDLSFREEYNYRLCGIIRKKAVYGLAQFVSDMPVIIPEEEIRGRWIIPYYEAIKKLNFLNDRRVLEKAHRRIVRKQNGRL